jgi:hypothetical protein
VNVIQKMPLSGLGGQKTLIGDCENGRKRLTGGNCFVYNTAVSV